MRVSIKHIFLALALLLSACGGNKNVGYMVDTDPKTLKQTLYSPCYELESVSDDKILVVCLVITLGPERVPKGYKHTGPFSDDLDKAYREGIVDLVSEIYFVNHSDAPIEVKPLSLKVLKKKKEFSGVKTINPHQWIITDPMIELNSNDGVVVPASFNYEYRGKKYVVDGIARRLTVDEVKMKYGGN